MSHKLFGCTILLTYICTGNLLPSPTGLTQDSEASEGSADDQGTFTNGNHLILVVGAAGTPEFAAEFESWASRWEQLAERQQWPITMVFEANEQESAKAQLEQAILDSAHIERLWVVLLGHGTFTRGQAKFNLTGPDVSSKELSEWLDLVEAQIVVVNCSSASAPFLTELAAEDRVVVTATRSGSEFNYARFGKFLSEAINDPNVDLDHDKEVSLLEAFLAASSQTERFYSDDSRLATEHALLNDNGDKAGTPADFYRGIRPVKRSKDGEPIDGGEAARVILLTSPDNPTFSPELEQQRKALEDQLGQLRESKSRLPDTDYFDRLEQIMLRLADLYDQAERQAKPQ